MNKETSTKDVNEDSAQMRQNLCYKKYFLVANTSVTPNKQRS